MQNVISQHIEYPSFIIPATEGKIKFCPSLSARNQEQRKLLLILFYVNTGSLLTCRHIKQNQMQTPKVVADFLQRIPQKGWASKAKPIPYPNKRTAETHKTKIRYKHRRWLLISCKGVPTRDGRAKRSQSLPQ